MHILSGNWQLPFLNQGKGENDRRKYFMINLYERMLPTSAGAEPATSWSPVWGRIQLSHQGRLISLYIQLLRWHVYTCTSNGQNSNWKQSSVWSVLFNPESADIFLILPNNICYGYSLEVPPLKRFNVFWNSQNIVSRYILKQMSDVNQLVKINTKKVKIPCRQTESISL